MPKTLSTLIAVCGAGPALAYLPAPDGLSVNLLRWPDQAVITSPEPVFGWVFPAVGGEQAWYRIRVAASPWDLKSGGEPLWDSGQVASSRNVGVPYGGPALSGRQAYWWQVQTGSVDGRESRHAEPQLFFTGNFDRSGSAYPGESRWVELGHEQWVLEDRQAADFQFFKPVRTVLFNSLEFLNSSVFLEFERAAFGYLELEVISTKAGAALEVHLGERRDGEAVHKEPGVSNIGYAKVEVPLEPGYGLYRVHIPPRRIEGYLHSQELAAHQPEVLPFRYAEIRGAMGAFRFVRARQAALFYPFDEEASAFAASNANLEAVWDLCKYTQKATPFLGVYADGNRERMPYEADAYIQMLSHFAVDREYSVARYTIEFLLDHASWPTEWQMHMPLMAWEYYMHTGDEDLLRRRYADLKVKSLIDLTEENGLISTRTGRITQDLLDRLGFPGKPPGIRDIVDWPPGRPASADPGEVGAFQSPRPEGERDGFVFTDYNSVVNAFHNRALQLMARIARVIGNAEEARFFEDRAACHLQIFNATFLDPQSGLYLDGPGTDHSSLHANMFPLAFGLVPVERVETVADFVAGRGMACSVYGAQYLLEALYDTGRAGAALDRMTAEDKRSWMNMIRVGASMTTEAWDEAFKPNLTWNHAWGSAPANIIVRKLAGIEPLQPAFQRFRIAPQPASLDHFSVKAPTLKGPVELTLHAGPQTWDLELHVPGNTTAELLLPGRFSRIHHNGLPVQPAGQVLHAGAFRQLLELAPGRHVIQASE